MTERERTNQRNIQPEDNSRGRAADDRRETVKPTDNPVPRSPEPEEDAVRDGEEKLARVKPY